MALHAFHCGYPNIIKLNNFENINNLFCTEAVTLFCVIKNI